MINVKGITGRGLIYSEGLGPKRVFSSLTGAREVTLGLVPISWVPVARKWTQATMSSTIVAKGTPETQVYA